MNAIVQESTTKGLMFYMGEEEQYGKMTVSFFPVNGKDALAQGMFYHPAKTECHDTQRLGG